MRLVVFPLQTHRSDARRGMLARRLAEAVSLRLPDAAFVEWTVSRGDEAAHVVIESALPTDVVRGELAARGGAAALVGSLTTTPLEVTLRTSLIGPGTEDALPEVVAPSLRAAVDELVQHVANAMGVEPLDSADDDDVLLARWADRDNAALVAASGVRVLSTPEDAWRHLLPLAAAGDADAQRTLRARRDAWAADGATRIAVRCAEAVAGATKADEDYLAWAEFAEANADTGEQEQALAAWSRAATRPGRARVRLGKLLISLRRAREAMPLLQEAIEDADCRDAAETYLGMACAAVGDLGRAVEHWRRVADEGKDTAFVRLAREQLQRVASVRGTS